MLRLISCVLFCALAFGNTYGAEHSFIFKTRTDNGPVTERTAVRVGYTLVNQRLTISGDLDTTTTPVLGMVLDIARYVGKRTYPLTGLTRYRYGQNSDHIFTCTSGSFTVENVDPETGTVTATFFWIGTATLANGTTLRINISEGRLTLALPPKLNVAVTPRTGVKVSPDENVPLKIKITKENGDPVQGATVTVKGLATLFAGVEPSKDYTTNQAGEVSLNYKTKPDAEKGKYQLTVSAKKDKFEPSDNLVYELEVSERGRFWYAKCGGLPFHEFDAGEGKKWKEDDVFVVADGPVVWNGIFLVQGPVRIDTTPGKLIVNCSSIKMAGSGNGGLSELVIVESTTAFSLPCSNTINFGLDKLATKLSGGIIEKPVIEILGNGYPSTGIKLGATIVLGKNVWSGCNSDNAKSDDPNEKAKFVLEGSVLYTSTAPPKWDFTASGELTNFAPVSALCINSAKLAYSSATNELDISGKARALCFASAEVGIGFKDSQWNKGNFTFELENCIPIPQTPLCFRGGGGSIENIAIGNPFKARIESTMELIGREEIMQFTLGGGFEAEPVAAFVDGTLRLLKIEKISAAKPWQIEVKAEARLSFDKAMSNPAFAITGAASVGHLGGDYILTGDANLTLTGTPLGYTGTVNGRCVIPNFEYTGEMKMPIKVLHEIAKDILPIQVGTVKGVMSITPGAEQYMRANVDLGPIRARLSGVLLDLFDSYFGTGQAHLVVDFDKTFPLEIGPGTINLTLGPTIGKAGDALQAQSVAATVGPQHEALLVHIQGASGTVTVTAPDGRSWTDASVEDGVKRFTLPNGLQVWTVSNPVSGVWTVAAESWDSIVVEGRIREQPFSVEARLESNILTLTWPVVQGGTVVIQADEDGENFDGIPLAVAPTDGGGTVIQLADGQVPCSFYVTAMRTLGGQVAEARTSGVFAAQRVTLMPPTNVEAVRNQAGRTTARWTVSESPLVRRYGVRARFDNVDTLVASVTRFESTATFDLPREDASVYVVSIGDGSTVGCPSPTAQVLTSIGANDVSVQAALPYPQPARDYVRVAVSGEVIAWYLTDVHGQRAEVTGGAVHDKLEVNLAGAATGSYMLTIRTAAGVTTYPVMVVR